MKFGDIIQFTIDRFDTLRKPTGKPYETKNVRKSIMCALSSNGVFEKLTIDRAFMHEAELQNDTQTKVTQGIQNPD